MECIKLPNGGLQLNYSNSGSKGSYPGFKSLKPKHTKQHVWDPWGTVVYRHPELRLPVSRSNPRRCVRIRTLALERRPTPNVLLFCSGLNEPAIRQNLFEYINMYVYIYTYILHICMYIYIYIYVTQSPPSQVRELDY